MSLLKTIMAAQDGAAVKRLADKYGLDTTQATSALGHLLPALTKNIKGNIQSDQGLEGLLGAIKNGNHSRYLDNPKLLGRKKTVKDGNGILGHILGSKKASRQVADDAARKTGIDVSILKKLLPMVAALTMGGLNKQASEPGKGGLRDLLDGVGQGAPVREQRSKGLDSMLGGLLDADNDGSVLDDVMGMAKKFL
ncbi:MAG: DUF937 domain-containing protein [Gammaproteobacteria bacterium]|nr:DUF937 domain-containing protein [Gammaproteobacteria bacterium]